jgi:undecaprenyl-phosphate 4-deoxy-4-formamido-L-arabinose transferase
MPPMLFSIVIPVFNASSTIKQLVEAIKEVLNKYDIEIILVNDGSHDNSHEICLSLYKHNESIVKYIQLSKNFGEHNAVMAGLHHANGDYVIIMDDDFQNPPEELPKIIQEVQKYEYDILYTKYPKTYQILVRRLGSRFTNWVANIIIDKPKDLYLSSFKCLSRFVVKELIQYKGTYLYLDGLALRCTRNIGCIEVMHQKSKNRCSRYSLHKLVRLWLNVLLNFSVIPLRVSTGLGAIFCMIAIVLLVMAIVDKIIKPDIPMGWPSLMISIVMFSGVQLLILGLIGEYVGRLFLSSNQTPQFIIRHIYNREKA